MVPLMAKLSIIKEFLEAFVVIIGSYLNNAVVKLFSVPYATCSLQDPMLVSKV